MKNFFFRLKILAVVLLVLLVFVTVKDDPVGGFLSIGLLCILVWGIKASVASSAKDFSDDDDWDDDFNQSHGGEPCVIHGSGNVDRFGNPL